MKRVKGIFALVLGVGAIASSVAPASAIPYNGNTVYKTVESGVTKVYISASPSSAVEVNLGLTDRYTSRVAGSCGEIVLSSSSVTGTTTVTANNSTINLSTLSTQLLPSCTNGSFAESRTSPFKTPDGKIVLVGYTANTAVTLNIPKPTTRKLTANACGFATLGSTSSVPLPASFMIGSTSYTVSSLANAGNAPRCSSGVGYVPATWLSSGSGN